MPPKLALVVSNPANKKKTAYDKLERISLNACVMMAPLASARQLPVVQLPKPGSMLAGQPVTDATSRQAAIEPIGNAVLALPGGSVALVSANMDNIYGILNQLGTPSECYDSPQRTQCKRCR